MLQCLIPSPFFLLSYLCSCLSRLPVSIFFTQLFTDFHFPNLFYSSVIDSRSVSFLPRGLTLSLSSSTQLPLLPRHIQCKCHFLFGSIMILIFCRLLPKLSGKVSFPSFNSSLLLHFQLGASSHKPV